MSGCRSSPRSAKTFAGVDAVMEPIPVCPGSALHDGRHPHQRPLRNAAARTVCGGRMFERRASTAPTGSARTRWPRSLVFGRVAGESAADYARTVPRHGDNRRPAPGRSVGTTGSLPCSATATASALATLRDEMLDTMEAGVGIYRQETTLQQACAALAKLRERYRRGVRLDDRSRAFNTEWLTAIELGFSLEVAEAMAHSALARRESRGAHMRLDGFEGAMTISS